MDLDTKSIKTAKIITTVQLTGKGESSLIIPLPHQIRDLVEIDSGDKLDWHLMRKQDADYHLDPKKENYILIKVKH